jgi:hypothetical protein
MSAGGNSGKQQQTDASVSNYFLIHSLQQFCCCCCLAMFWRNIHLSKYFSHSLNLKAWMGCHSWCMEVPLEHCSSKQFLFDGDLPFMKVSFRASPPGYINNLDNGKIKWQCEKKRKKVRIAPHCCACELQNIQAWAKNNVLTSTFVIDPRVSPTWNSNIIASITLTTTPPPKWP